MKNFWAAYSADTEKEQKGVWRDFKGGLRLKISRADLDTNPIYAQAYQEILTGIDENDAEAAANAMRKLYARSIVMDGEVNGKPGLINKKGEFVEFSPEVIIDIFIGLPELFKEVRLISNHFDNYVNMVEKAGDQLGK